MINGMVNWAIFVKIDEPNPSNLFFTSEESAKLFAILLGDFLSQITPSREQTMPLGLRRIPTNTSPSNLTFLFYLRQICNSPRLGGDAKTLNDEVEKFASWLEGDFIAPGVHLANLSLSADITISRLRYLKICGDIAKHNLMRLSRNVAYIRQAIEQSGHAIDEQQSYMVVEDFFNWFFHDIFIYHSSCIAEFLNNIRWAIFDYLLPEYQRSWHATEGAELTLSAYSYRYPADVAEPISKAMYWNLMNRIRLGRWVHRFEIPDGFKSLY